LQQFQYFAMIFNKSD